MVASGMGLLTLQFLTSLKLEWQSPTEAEMTRGLSQGPKRMDITVYQGSMGTFLMVQ